MDIVWGELDFLFIDLPPGTGDEPLSIAQLLPEMDGVVIVTMPTGLSSTVVKKAITFAERLNMPIIGVVENMSGFVCPHCGTKTEIFQSGGGKKMAQETGVPFLGSIPIDPKVGADSDKGQPFVIAHKESSAAVAFMEIVAKVEAYLKNKNNLTVKRYERIKNSQFLLLAVGLLFCKRYFYRGNHSGPVFAFSWWHLCSSDCNFCDLCVFYEAASCYFCNVNGGGDCLSSCFEGYFFLALENAVMRAST